MARPNKVGLDYFSLDVKFDDEVELIKAQHGIKGLGILITMYQTIYADKGYYRKWNERNQILFSNKVSEDRNEVVNVINDCIKWDIFDKKMYEKHGILTSRRIQKQYIKATYKRSEVEIIEDFLLINKDDRGNITYIKVSDDRNSKTTKVTDSKSTQSNKDKDKNKESKEEKNNNTCAYPTLSSLKRNEAGHRDYPDKFEQAWEEYPKRDGSANKGGGYEKFRARVNEGVSVDKLIKAAKNYKTKCENEGDINTKYVMQMSKFYGAKDIWLEYAEKNINSTEEEEVEYEGLIYDV